MMHIVFSANEKFVPHMGVVMASILANSSAEDEFFFHIISDSISGRSRSNIMSLREIKHFEFEIVDASDTIRDRTEEIKRVARCCHLTASATYFRLFIGSIFPDLEKILYLDSDIVVSGSLQGIWGTDLSSSTIAVVEEPEAINPPDPFLDVRHYFNSGVILFNLARWRSLGYEGKCLSVQDHILEKIRFAEQSIFNHVFRDGDVRFLGIENNYIVCLQDYIREEHFTGSLPCDPIIIHYAGLKPWDLSLDIFSKGTPQPPIFSHYWKYRSISPWRNEPFKGAIRWKDVFRYAARHPKEIPFLLDTVSKWRKAIYQY